MTKQQFTTTKVHVAFDKSSKTKPTQLVNLSEESNHTKVRMSSAWSSRFKCLGKPTLPPVDSEVWQWSKNVAILGVNEQKDCLSSL